MGMDCEVTRHNAKHLLDRISVLRNRCDLDLLIFFARHPRALLTSEQLALWVGCDVRQVAASLDALLGANLVKCAENPTQLARMYVFTADANGGGWLPPLLELTKSREGRLALIEALSPGPRGGSDASATGRVQDAAGSAGAPSLSVVRSPDAVPKTGMG